LGSRSAELNRKNAGTGKPKLVARVNLTGRLRRCSPSVRRATKLGEHKLCKTPVNQCTLTLLPFELILGRTPQSSTTIPLCERLRARIKLGCDRWF